MSTALAVPDDGDRRPVPIHSGPSLHEIERVAELLAESSMVPQSYRRQPANIVLAALTGRALGWDVTASMRNLTVIQGTATIKPEAMLAMVRAAGHSVSGETSNTAATVTGRRRDTGDTMSFTFTIEDAQRAKLASKDNWRNFPASMLWARAVSQLCRMLFPDVLLGLSYVPEELGALVDETGEVVGLDPQPAIAKPATVTAEALEASVAKAFASAGLTDEDASRWWVSVVAEPEPEEYPRHEATAIWEAAKVAAADEAARQAASETPAEEKPKKGKRGGDPDLVAAVRATGAAVRNVAPVPSVAPQSDVVDAELVDEPAADNPFDPFSDAAVATATQGGAK